MFRVRQFLRGRRLGLPGLWSCYVGQAPNHKHKGRDKDQKSDSILLHFLGPPVHAREKMARGTNKPILDNTAEIRPTPLAGLVAQEPHLIGPCWVAQTNLELTFRLDRPLPTKEKPGQTA